MPRKWNKFEDHDAGAVELGAAGSGAEPTTPGPASGLVRTEPRCPWLNEKFGATGSILCSGLLLGFLAIFFGLSRAKQVLMFSNYGHDGTPAALFFVWALPAVALMLVAVQPEHVRTAGVLRVGVPLLGARVEPTTRR